MMKVAVLGASPKPDHYSNMAVRLLREKGHEVIPVNPNYKIIENLSTVATLDDIKPGEIHSLTVYVNPARSTDMAPLIKRLKSMRVIFNPGTENPPLESELQEAGIEVVHACTLVMLKTGIF